MQRKKLFKILISAIYLKIIQIGKDSSISNNKCIHIYIYVFFLFSFFLSKFCQKLKCWQILQFFYFFYMDYFLLNYCNKLL